MTPRKRNPKPKWKNRIVGEAMVMASELTPNPLNWRTHPGGQRAALGDVLSEVGWVQRVVVNQRTGRIVDGHLRVEQAADAGEQVPVVYVDLTEEEERLMLLTLDPMAAMAEADTANLAELLEGLDRDDDLGKLLDAIRTDYLPPAEIPADADDVPEAPAIPTTKPGDLWLLGDHRLLCGDATSAEDVARLLGGAVPSLLLTDPPYSSGGRQDGQKRQSTSIGTRAAETIARDNLTTRGYLALMGRVLGCVDAEAAYVFTDWRMWAWTFDALEAAGYPVRNMLVWDKESMGMGFPWRNQHELVAFAKRTGAKMGDGKVGNVLRAKRTGNELHPTQKPTELIETILANTPGDSAYDPFAGSGTTIIAAEQLGRRCYAMEIDPTYVDVAVIRWENLTGREATLDTDGRTFVEVAAERGTLVASK